MDWIKFIEKFFGGDVNFIMFATGILLIIYDGRRLRKSGDKRNYRICSFMGWLYIVFACSVFVFLKVV